LRAKGFGRHSTMERSISGMSRSASSACVFIAFALRGASCGNDPGNGSRNRDYHDQQTAGRGPSHDSHPILCRRVFGIRRPERHRALRHRLCFQEGDAMVSEIGCRLPRIPVITGHGGTVAGVAYPALTPC
jgi:hypothetical protein